VFFFVGRLVDFFLGAVVLLPGCNVFTLACGLALVLAGLSPRLFRLVGVLIP
jgi:hypothetical protein